MDNLTTNTSTASNSSTNMAATTATQGLLVKNGINYFDNASGYLVYSSMSPTTNVAKEAGYVILAVDLFKGQSTKDKPSHTISKNC